MSSRCVYWRDAEDEQAGAFFDRNRLSYLDRFGDALNEHIHYHCSIIDALFFLDDGALRICELPR